LSGAERMMDDEDAIRALIQTWMEASRNGDDATILSLMTEDAVFMVAGQAPFGREVFEAAAGKPRPQVDATATIIELKILGDWAFTRAHIALTITPPGGMPMQRSGYTMSLFHKAEDGQWKLARDANLLS